MERLVFRHPLYARDSLGVLGDYVTLEAGTGAVHTAPGHGADDYKTGVRYGLEIYAPLDPGGHFNESVEMFAGLEGHRRESEDRSGAQGARLPVASRGLRSLVPALLALPQPGDLPRHLAVVHRDGREAPARARAARRSTRHALDPVVGPGAHRGHDRQPARLVHLAPARLGRADPGDGLHEVRHAGADQGARRQGGVGVRRLRRRRVVRAAGRGVHPRGHEVRRVRRHANSSARATSSTSGSIPDRATKRCCRSARIITGRRTSISKAAISIAAGSTARCSSASARAAARRSTRC